MFGSIRELPAAPMAGGTPARAPRLGVGRSGHAKWFAPLCFAALIALHWPWLRLPYYWDEAGYYIPAALDFFRHGRLVPYSTLVTGHPPLLSLWLSLAWRIAGFHPASTRVAMLAVAAFLLWGLFHLGREAVPELHAGVAWAAVLLCGATPLFFAQATLAQLDLPAAALAVWALLLRRRESKRACAAVVTLACLTKETALLVPAAWLISDLFWGLGRWRGGRGQARPRLASLPSLVCATVAVAIWFLYVHHVSGLWLADPSYLSYNVSHGGGLGRAPLALIRRAWQLLGYNGTWLVTGIALAAAARRRAGVRMWRPVEPASCDLPPLHLDCMAVIAAYLAFHALIGGAVLARYLLPAVPLYLLLAADAIVRLPRAGWAIAACVAFLVVNWFWNPPYPFPYEDNLAYTRFVRLQQQSAAVLVATETASPAVHIWTAWPATDELRNPDLGYVARPLPVHALPDFSAAALAQARPGRPALLLLYSRQFEPAHDASRLPLWRAWSQRYFAYVPPAAASAWLAELDLHARVRLSLDGQWALIASRGFLVAPH